MPMSPVIRAIALLLTGWGSASGQAPALGTGRTVAFTNVGVVPMDRERVLTDQTVVVRGGRIVALGAAGQIEVPKDAQRIDGRGKFLIPGLADMHAHVHVHFPVERTADSLMLEHMLFLYLANGVTTVRNMEELQPLALRDRAARGELFSPHIYSSGHRLFDRNVASPQAAADVVAKEQAAGYDFLKMYQVRPETFDSVVTAARRLGMPISGHVPQGVSLERALAVPYRSIEHLTGYVEALAAERPAASRSARPSMAELAGIADESKIPLVAAATRRAGVWNVPTYNALANLTVDTDSFTARPEIRYVSEKRLDMWLKKKQAATRGGDAGVVERLNRVFELHRKLIKGLHDAGAGLLLGADAPDNLVVPGFSIHHELQALVAAGLTPYQALETGTRNPAIFLGTLDSAGTVETGKRADLVLLSGNPLTDVRHTAAPAGVMIGGRWLARADIDARLGPLEKSIN